MSFAKWKSGKSFTKLAVLFGIDEYRSLSRLKYAVGDATAFAKALRSKYGFRSEEIMLSTSSGRNSFLSQNVLREQIAFLRRLSEPVDLLIVGFWGHGFRGADGRRYLCAVDAVNSEVGDLERTGVSLDETLEVLSKARARNILAVLDCCQNFTDGRASSPLFTKVDEDELKNAARDVVAASQVPNKPGESPKFVRSFAILNSCSAGQKSFEWDKRKHGLFTAHLLDAMKNGAASVVELAEYTRAAVPKTAFALRRNQTPFFELSGAANDFYLKTDKISDSSFARTFSWALASTAALALGAVAVDQAMKSDLFSTFSLSDIFGDGNSNPNVVKPNLPNPNVVEPNLPAPNKFEAPSSKIEGESTGVSAQSTTGENESGEFGGRSEELPTPVFLEETIELERKRDSKTSSAVDISAASESSNESGAPRILIGDGVPPEPLSL